LEDFSEKDGKFLAGFLDPTVFVPWLSEKEVFKGPGRS